MSGYTRQSSSDLVPTAVVRSSPLNTEYNKIRDAFAFDITGTTGHRHDGSSDEGSYVPLIADLDALNKVAIDTGNSRVGFFVEVSSAAVEQARLSDGLFAPVTTNDVDLGAVTAKFKDLHLAGDANVGGDLNLTGDLVGNVTGNLTGNVTGDVTGDLSGNVTAASGSSSFTNVTINGTLDVTNTPITNVSDPTSAQEAATKIYVDTTDNLKLNLSGGTMSGAIAMGASKITGLGDPTLAQDAATKAYVDSEVSSLVDAAPGALNTLNELAAAIGDDASFSTTVTNSIAAKLPLSGGTMSGAIEMGTSKITGLGDPTLAQDAATKAYTDTVDNLKLNLSGGTMGGAIAMGNSKITGLGTPTTGTDATTKTYVDGILGSATDSAASAAAALVSENNAAASYDAFDDRYLGSKASDPAVDNDGDALLTGALYFNTASEEMRVYTGSLWKVTGSSVNGTSQRSTYTATASQTTFSSTYDVGFVDVYLNGIKLVSGTDFTASNGTSVVLSVGATADDIVDIVAYGAFSVPNALTVSGDLSDLNDVSTARTNLGLGTMAVEPAGDYAKSTWTTKTTTYTAVVGDRILADTGAGAWTLTLPASPTEGQQVQVADHGGDWATNNLTIDGGAADIEGAGTLVCNNAGDMFTLVYEGAEWKKRGGAVSSSAVLAILVDEKTAGTPGGALSATTWNQRDLNTERYDPLGLVTLSTNTFSCSVDCVVSWSCPAFDCNSHKTKLVRVSDSATIAVGSSAFSASSDQVATMSLGTSAIDAGVSYRIEHYVSLQSVTTTSTGGVQVNGSEVEVYSQVIFWS
jgi:hypothetical protein